MKTVDLMLIRSRGEGEEERRALEEQLRRLNEISLERGLRFRLLGPEEGVESGSCRLCLLLLFNRADEALRRSFEEAYRLFRETGSPAILTFFHRGEGYAPEQSLLEFSTHLSDELGHYYKTFESFDTVMLSLLMQIKLMDLDLPVEFRDGEASVDGKRFLSLESLPALANNTDFRRLKEDLARREQEYLLARTRFPEDPGREEEFLQAARRRNESRDALRELEKDLCALMLSAQEQSAGDGLSARQRKALELVEQGRCREAESLLDLGEILTEAAGEEALAERLRARLEQRVRELMQKIGILRTLRSEPGRFDRIREVYGKAVELEERNHLSKRAMRAFCAWLYERGENEAAVRSGLRCRTYLELEGDPAYLAELDDLLGLAHLSLNEFEEAEEELQRAGDALERLARKDEGKYLVHAAEVWGNLGVLYETIGDASQAEESYLRARSAYERLSRSDPGGFRGYLAGVWANLGDLYRSQGRTSQGEKALRKAVELYSALAAEHPETFSANLAAARINLGKLMHLQGRVGEAEEEYTKAEQLLRPLEAEDPLLYLPWLANVSGLMGVLLAGQERYLGAGMRLSRSKQIYEALAKEDPKARDDLVSACMALGDVHKANGLPWQAEPEYRRAAELLEELAREDPRYLRELEQIWASLGMLCDSLGETAREEAAYLRAKELLALLPADQQRACRNERAGICNNLGALYHAAGHFDRAEREYGEAEALFAALAAEDRRFRAPLRSVQDNRKRMEKDRRRQQGGGKRGFWSF